MSEFHALDLGLVVAGFGRHYLIETPEGRRITCTPRGKKSDCVVGDRVRWMPTNSQGGEGVIEHIEPRRNLLFRQDALKTKAFAANLDQVLVMVASLPVFSESQLARALIAAEHAQITAHIILNKTDLPEITAARARLAPYVAMGYHVLQLGLKTDADASLALLEARVKGKASLVLGPSGAGKSTLINLMAPMARAAVGEISQALQAGRHTTTHTQWHWLDAQRETALLDSPGFQEFGLRQIKAEQLARLMPDLAPHTAECKFYNCTHQHEPACGVRAALERGDITASRYRIYGELWREMSTPRW
jgi:ribosome biogenesis GTPase / thiamine phosphate phosphatase